MPSRDGDDNGDNHTMKSIKGSDESESDSSSSNSSSPSGPPRIAPPDQNGLTPLNVEEKAACNDNPPRDDPDQNPSLFNPNEKGTKKQKRCDYDSDDRSYDGLGLDYRRRNLSTTARKDAFLPGTTNMIDFDYQGTKTWGDRLLFETLKDPEIDALVGLATSYDLGCSGNKNKNGRRKRDVRTNADAQNTPLSSPSFTKTTASTDKDNIFFHNPLQHNPLLSVAYDSPLPPSHIDYIKSRVVHRSHQPSGEAQDRYRREEKNRNKNMEGDNIESPFKDSVAVAMSMYLEESLTASLLPLAGLHVLRCRALEAMTSAETEVCPMPEASFDNNIDDSKQRRRREIHNNNDPAFALQTTVPYPITGQQVKMDMNCQIRWKEENAFQEWTLPPEEAILKLMEQGILPNDFPYQFVPDACRSWIPAHLHEANHRNRNELPNGSPSNDSIGSCTHDDNNHVAMWAKNYKVNPRVLSANREIFDIFLTKKTTTLAKESQQPPL